MILSNEWERESAILMILGVHATKFLLCTPKTPIDNGFHSLSRFRHFITEWFSSQTRIHSSTKWQYYRAHKQLDSNIEFSISYSRFLRCKSKIWRYRIHWLRIFHRGFISFQILFFFIRKLSHLSRFIYFFLIFSLIFIRDFILRGESSD